MLITTKDNIKTFLGITGSGEDAILVALALAVSQHFEKYIGRKIETIERTEYFDVNNNQTVFHLSAFPISACLVYNDDERTFGSSSLVAASNYTYLGSWGELIFDDYDLVSGPKNLKVVYTGGMAASQATFQTAYQDIETAARLQAAFWKERLKNLGLANQSMKDGIQLQYEKLQLLPTVKEVLNPYRKILYV